MKIGLIGAPGSGKTKLAQRLANELVALDIIDGYVPRVEGEFDYSLGGDATYVGNLAIALERHRLERQMKDCYVTCGTVIDTATYMAAETYFNPEHEGWQRRSLASLAVIGCMVDDLMSYDHLFYLPEVEGTPQTEFFQTVITELPTAIRLFEKSVTTLSEDPEARLEQALAHMAWINEAS